MKIFYPTILTLFLAVCPTQAESIPQLTETAEQTEERMKWFRDAKFGLFIHWGPASISGEEISWGMKDRIEAGAKHQKVPRDTYMNLYKEFNPTKFNADKLLSLADKAGMKYLVFVTKHHDGFSMWPTKEKRFPANSSEASESGLPEHFSIADTPYKKDILKEVRDATLKHGLKLGWYYSTRDWTHPEYLQGDNKIYNDYYENQVEELLSDYGPVDILWFDHCFGKWDQYTIPRLHEKMYSHNPQLLLNNRAARGLPDIPEEYTKLAHADYDTPENRKGAFQHGRPWESCMILSPHPDHGGWSYRPESITRSLTETIQLLSSCVTGDGNMLLNLAPLPDGTILPAEQAILEGIAPWMEKYSEAIYKTRGGPWINGSWGGSTYRENNVYLHLFPSTDEESSDKSQSLTLNLLPENVISATSIDGKAIIFNQDKNKGTIKVTLPATERNEHVSIIKLTLDAPVSGVLYGPALAHQKENEIPGTLTFPTKSAKITGNLKLDKDTITNWSNPKNTLSWPLEIDSPGKYTVQLTTSCESPGSIITAHFGKGIKGIHGAVPVTGSHENFQTFTLGTVYFPNAESIELKIAPAHHHSWKNIHLRNVQLIPEN